MATNAENNQLKKATDPNQAPAGTPSTGGSAAPSQPSGRVASYSTGQSLGPSSQGSGRFTNIKNYINANQGAGEQLGSKITGNIEKNLNKTEKEQQTAASNIAANVQAEKDRLAEANTFNTQLQDENSTGAQDINNNNDSQARFKALLNNQNNAGTLQTNAQSAADAATAAYNKVGQQVQNLGSESGRFNLLQQSVKNPQYTQGQQRLDQLFLQTSNPNQLAQNQRDLGKQAQASAQGLTNQYNDLGQQIQQTGTQAQDVSQMLGNTLNTQQQNLVNAQIAEAQAKNTSNAAANTALQTYFTNGYGSLSADQKALIDPMISSGGLSAGMHTYNVLNNGGYNNYLNQGSTNLTGADVLDQNEFARYNALAQLAGNTNPLYTQAGSGGIAAGIKANELTGAINQAQADLMNKINKQYSASMNNNMNHSGSGNVTASALGTDLLNFYNQGATAGQASPFTNTYDNPYGPGWNLTQGSYANNAVSGYVNPYAPGVSNKITGADGLGFNVGTGTDKGGYAAAQAWQQFYNDLVAAGYGNSLGGTGNYSFGNAKDKVTGNV